MNVVLLVVIFLTNSGVYEGIIQQQPSLVKCQEVAKEFVEMTIPPNIVDVNIQCLVLGEKI